MAAEAKAHGLGAYRRVLAAPLVLPLLSAQTVATLPAGMGAVALALPGTTVEAFTWMGLSLTVGASAGSALAGPIVAAGGWRSGVAVACVAPALAGLIALGGRRLLEVG